jgi:hypothetical protein
MASLHYFLAGDFLRITKLRPVTFEQEFRFFGYKRVTCLTKLSIFPPFGMISGRKLLGLTFQKR